MYRDRCIDLLLKSKGFKQNEELKKYTQKLSLKIRSAQSFFLEDTPRMLEISQLKGRPLTYESYSAAPFNLCWVSADCSKVEIREDSELSTITKAAALVEKTDDMVRLSFFYEAGNDPEGKGNPANQRKIRWLFEGISFVFYKGSNRVKFVPVPGYERQLRAMGFMGQIPTKTLAKDYSFDAILPAVLFKILSCKNIVPIKNFPNAKINKKRKMTGKEPLYTYHTLDVILPGRRRMTEPGEPTGRTVRLHLCRGHFKEYTPERPLFGKYTGRYWWQPIARGDKKAGVVMKDYNVKNEGSRA